MSKHAKIAVENLRKMIHRSKQTSYSVAKGAGISKAAISQYLSGKRIPTIPVLEKIATYLEVPFTDFFKPL